MKVHTCTHVRIRVIVVPLPHDRVPCAQCRARSRSPREMRISRKLARRLVGSLGSFYGGVAFSNASLLGFIPRSIAIGRERVAAEADDGREFFFFYRRYVCRTCESREILSLLSRARGYRLRRLLGAIEYCPRWLSPVKPKLEKVSKKIDETRENHADLRRS